MRKQKKTTIHGPIRTPKDLVKHIDLVKKGKNVIINDMKEKIMCSLCPETERKWEDVKDEEALKNHKLEKHNLIYCERCFKDIKAGKTFDKHVRTHKL